MIEVENPVLGVVVGLVIIYGFYRLFRKFYYDKRKK